MIHRENPVSNLSRPRETFFFEKTVEIPRKRAVCIDDLKMSFHQNRIITQVLPQERKSELIEESGMIYV